ncbi:alkaline phosphatase D family protein [Verrucomicrobiaceae bacterium R5-34]|nr:alkaline phosphatase D family protein [Verrucomicrobiaceae bacterium R5-34]
MKRRHFLTLLTAVLGQPYLRAAESLTTLTRIDRWNLSHDRIFLGGEFWANPMEDWRVEKGWASCLTGAANRSIHSLVYDLTQPNQPFTLSTEVMRPATLKKDHGAGFRIGITADIADHRARCFANNGYRAGIQGNQLILGKKMVPLAEKAPAHTELTLVGKPSGTQVELTLTATDPASGKSLGSATTSVPAIELTGNIALASQYPAPGDRSANRPGKHDGSGYKFRNWQISGDAFSHHQDRQFGPILWAMYSLSDNRNDDRFVMKLTALVPPLGEKDNHTLSLEVKRDGVWKKLGEAKAETDSWTATFRVPQWNESEACPYRISYLEKHSNGSETSHSFTGTIRANPSGRPLRIGALTCQNDIGFPYQPVADNLVKLDTDLLYFSGDQLYEQHGGFGILRKPAVPAIHNYLRKFYQFGWAFREAMRHAPTICLPDDHDVFHGNLWGGGGVPWNQDAKGPSRVGYHQPARMINAVHRTNCSHHPDFASPKPCKQDISVYYGDMLYGGVNFAIIADRQWKSGPETVNTSGARYDHVTDPDFDTSTLDQPGLSMLGERQEKFLEKWSKDWRGHSMKVLLSQTVFAAVATYHGARNGYLKGDLDSGGWPQTPRNRAIDLIRESMALHINGDQHLTTLVQYGVEQQRDSNWSFCTPAISVGYPRWWKPDELKTPHTNRPKHGLPDTGEYIDGFGNKAYVYAVGNPLDNPQKGAKDRYEVAHNKASGFGLVTINSAKKTYTMDCFRFLVDATDGKASNQFPGWPVTVHQKENKGDNIIS